MKKTITILAFLVFLSLFASAEEVSFTGLEIAQMTREGLINTLYRNGSYTYMQRCDDEGNCDDIYPDIVQNYAWLARADAGLYTASGEKEHLNTARREMAYFLELCQKPTTNAADCAYAGSHAFLIYNLTGERRFLGRMFDDTTIEPIRTGLSTMLIPTLSRDWLLSYQAGFEKSVNSIARSLLFMDLVVIPRENKTWFTNSENDINIPVDICYMQLANIEMYKTLDQMPRNELDKLVRQRRDSFDLGPTNKLTPLLYKAFFLQRANNFFANSRLGDVTEDKSFMLLPLVEVQPCVESLMELEKLKGDSDTMAVPLDLRGYPSYYATPKVKDYPFGDDAKEILQSLVDQRWDWEGSPIFEGDNLFLSQACRPAEDGYACYQNLKMLNDNAWAVWLFSQYPDTVFTINKKEKITHYGKSSEDPGFAEYFATTTTTTLAKPIKPQVTPPTISFEVFVIILLLIILVVYFMRKKPPKNPPGYGDVKGDKIQEIF